MKKLQAAIEAEKDPNTQALGGVLMEICKLSPQALELVEQDLDSSAMSIGNCFAALEKHARSKRENNCWACPVFEITPSNEVVKVILDFYKIPPGWLEGQAPGQGAPARGKAIDLFDLL